MAISIRVEAAFDAQAYVAGANAADMPGRS